MADKTKDELHKENAELRQHLEYEQKAKEQLQSRLDKSERQGAAEAGVPTTVVVEAGETFEDGVQRILDRLAPPKPQLEPVGEISRERRLAAEEMRVSLQNAFQKLGREALVELARRAGIPDDEIGSSSNEQLAEKLADRPSPPRG